MTVVIRRTECDWHTCNVVIARIVTPDAAAADLRPGDLIHEINGKDVFSVGDLKNVLAGLTHGDAVALFIERARQWSYVAFNLL